MTGKQGGNVEQGTVLDLSSCVNPYGPAPRALGVLSEIDSSVIKQHPYEAATLVEELYAKRLDVNVNELVATRGASEAIWHLASATINHPVALPLPTYTEYLKAIVNHIRVDGGPTHSVEQLANAANNASTVIFSNPHNPTGTFIGNSELINLVQQFPNTTFIVDESYADFLENPPSITGCNADNVITIRSPTKFFGLGGVRIGVVWSKNQTLLSSLRAQRTTWPVSMIDYLLVSGAFLDTEWQFESRRLLANDVSWLDSILEHIPEVRVTPGALHFRLVTGNIFPFVNLLKKNGIAVRVFHDDHGVGADAFRIAAPTTSKRNLISNLINSVLG